MKTVSLIFSLFLSISSFSQSISNLKFSSPILTNPAFTGLRYNQELNLRFSHYYAFNALYVDYNQYSKNLHGGVGVYVNSGRFEFGNLNFNNFGLSYAYQNKFKKNWHYSLGASFGIKSLKNTIDNDFSLDYDLNFGGLLYTNKFYTSLSINNIYPNYTNYKLGFGYKLTPFKNKKISFTPAVTIKYQNKYFSADANLTMKYKKLMVGVGYNNNNLSTSIGYDFKRFKLNYNFGNLGNNFSIYNSHEFSILFKVGDLKKSSNQLKFNPNLF